MKKREIYTLLRRFKIKQKKLERLRRKSAKKKRQRNIINNGKKNHIGKKKFLEVTYLSK